MNVEEMLKFLGVRTQSMASIELCYMMDVEAFNMMSDEKNDYKNDRYLYNCVYRNLMDELNYKKLNDKDKKEVLEAIKNVNLDEDDKDYRDLHFTGLERILLRFNRHDLICFQAMKESSIEGMAKDAYLYELNGDFVMASAYYKKLGYLDRLKKVEEKLK